MKDEIHVWRVDLDAPADDAPLDAAERARAGAFRFPLHQQRFARGRAALRRVLGSYLGVPAERVVLTVGPHGKPALARGCGAIAFNLAHSAEVALLAVTAAATVGIDVEHCEPRAHLDALAADIFAPAELQAWGALPPEGRLPAFYRAWTRKEACLKALGTGLTIPPSQVLTGFDDVPALVDGAGTALQVLPLALGDGLAAAIAVPAGGAPRLVMRGP